MNAFMEHAERFISEHLQDEFTLDEIADFCGYSPFHFARKFKETVDKTVMESVREKRIFAAAEMIRNGSSICSAAMEYGFKTHAGFTKAFHAVFGCCPRDYTAHCCGNYWKGFDDMNNSKILIRPVMPDDVNDLWENVYSAMTPKEITEVKILPAIEREKNKSESDNNYCLTGDGRDELMRKLLDEMKIRCKEMGISTLISPQDVGSENAKAFIALGFQEAWVSYGWTYLAMSV